MESRISKVTIGKPVPLEEIESVRLSGRYRGGAFVRMSSVTAVGVDFSGLKFDYLGTVRCVFEDCDFRRVRIDAGSIDRARFVRCRFDGFRPRRNALFGDLRFEDCTFENVKLKDWWPEAAEFIGCRFTGVLQGLQLWGSPPPWNVTDPPRSVNEIRDNDFTGAALIFPDFRAGVDLAANRWPSGPDYLLLDRWPARVERARAAVARWPDDAERELALWWLRQEGMGGRELQLQALIHTPDWKDIEPRAVWPKLWALLAELASDQQQG
jgi:hypothetical protein